MQPCQQKSRDYSMDDFTIYHVPDYFPSYPALVTFVLHALNTHHNIPLNRVEKYTGIPLSRLSEARKVRSDRKQLMLDVNEYRILACLCFENNAVALGLAMLRFGVTDWVRVHVRDLDKKLCENALDSAISLLNTVKEEL